jgi:trk system potassium uptake protein TrkA
MYVIIAGCGKLGSGLAKVLSSQGHDVVAVCLETERASLQRGFDGVVVCGNPTDADVLRAAGAEKAALLVAATADDNLNVMVTQVARQFFHVPTVLARISDPEREKLYKGMGLSTVCPTTTGINQILRLIQKGSFSTLGGYLDSGLVGVKPLPEWIGKTPAQIGLPADRTMIGRVKPGGVSQPPEERPIEADETLILARRDCA